MTRILIAAFDGLLPRQVHPDLTPTIYGIAQRGVRFTRHHSVFPTVTRANSATMVTGCYPGKHGIPANRSVFPDHDPHSVMDVLQPGLDAVRSGPAGRVLFVPTIGELLSDAGMTHVSVVGGTSGNAYVHFPEAAKVGRGGVIHPEFSLPADLGAAESEMLGPWPPKNVPAVERVERVARSACEFVIPEINPEVLFVWFPEPDTANHEYGINSEQSNRGLATADAGLSRILQTLARQGDDPDVFVISDHGYSTISKVIEPAAALEHAGFTVNRGEGSVLVGNNGGSLNINYPGVDEDEVARLFNWLASQDWAGPIFSSLPSIGELGALPAATAFMDGPRTPHLSVSMAWNAVDAVGTAWNASASPVGAGLHGSASPAEIRNTLLTAGPSFKQGIASSAPTGNVDLAPTVLRLLGLDVPSHMDGRVVDEALVGGPDGAELAIQSDESCSKLLNVQRTQFVRRVSGAGFTYLESAGIVSA